MNPSNSTFVGREREMAELKVALDEAISGRGRLVMLAGEPGIGKTRTVQELADIAEERGVKVLWGRCLEQQGSPPYWPWVQTIRSYVREREAEQLRSEMGSGAADIAEIISEVKERLPDLGTPPTLESPEQARFRLFDSITNFLKVASLTQPILLILDDLHWADGPSLLLLEFLIQELTTSCLLVVGTYRDVELSRQHPLSEVLGDLTRERLFQRVALSGLSQEEVGRFMHITAGVKRPRELVEAVHSNTEGNPLFVAEVLRMLEQEGEPPPESLGTRGTWDFRIPEGIREAIGRRLNRLTEECNRMLTIASVIGQVFNFNHLVALIDELTEDQLLKALDEALDAGVLEDAQEGIARYQFTHALIQRTLRDELSAARRVRLIAQFAVTLEEQYGSDAQAHSSELAYYFAEAELVLGNEKLVYYSLLAGERALATYAWEDALGHFQRGLDAKEEGPIDADKAALLFGLARAQTATLQRYRLPEAITTMGIAFKYYVAEGDVSTALAIAEYPFRYGQSTEMAQILAEALTMVPSESLQAGHLLARYGLASIRGHSSFEIVIEALGRALVVARREKDTALETTVLIGMAHAHWIINLSPKESLENSLRAIEIGVHDKQIEVDHNAHWWAAMSLIALGDLEGAQPHAAACLAIAEKRGERVSISQGLHGNQDLAHLQGNWETARQFSERGLALGHRDIRLISGRAILEYELGDFSQGDAFLEQLVETTRLSQRGPTLEYSIVPFAIGMAARITGVARQFDVAEATAYTAMSSPIAATLFTQLARTGLALIAIERGDVIVAGEQYELLKARRLTITPLHLMCGHRVLGLLAQTMGKMDDAAAHFEDSLAFCRKAGARPELAWTSYDYAVLRLAQGVHGEVTVLLEQALAISTELGMRPLAEKVAAIKEGAEAEGTGFNVPRYPAGLTVREVEVLRFVAVGKMNREIAGELDLSVRTVERHISNIYSKISSGGRAEATAFAFTHGLMPFK